jgi:hypothetical protein
VRFAGAAPTALNTAPFPIVPTMLPEYTVPEGAEKVRSGQMPTGIIPEDLMRSVCGPCAGSSKGQRRPARSRVDHIVTGDKDLLRLGRYDSMRIVTVSDFLDLGKGMER